MPGFESITLRLPDGYEAHARFWRPANVLGAVLYLHGIQSHGLWFERSAERLAEAGLAVLLPDRRGSGRNTLERGHAPSARRLLQDCVQCIERLAQETGLPSAHVVGVSWGGKLALALARYAPELVASLALVAPGLFPRVDVPASVKLKIGLSVFTTPRRLFDIPLDEPQLFTANPERVRFIENDPLRLRQVTAAFLIASRRLDGYARGAGRNRHGKPLRLFLAGLDRIIDTARTREFIRRLGWNGRGIIEYNGAHHTLEFEPDPEPYISDLVEWISEQPRGCRAAVQATPGRPAKPAG